MLKFHKKLFLFLITPLVLIAACTVYVYAQTATPDPSVTPTPTSDSNNSATVADLQQKISQLEGKVSELQSQEHTLSSQISTMDSQIKLTEYRIDSTKQQITDLTIDIDSASKRMANLESSLSNVTKVLLNRIVATYQMGSASSMQVILTSSDVNDLVSRANYLRIVQAHDKQLLYDTQQARNDYANQKLIFEDKKKKIVDLQVQLEQYSKQLDQQKADEQKLLTETQGSEENYQRILAETKAQLAGFSNFTQSQGGAGLLSNQTVCDDWGCYYNQRDSQWGGNSLNSTQYSLASDGCLITSMAMVYTHYGHRDVTPQSINSVSSNFDGIPAALLKYTISANGTSATRSSADIDSTLASGNPVIIGISYDGGPYPDHFLVLVSGSGGNYTMKDPYTANGNNISFRGRYPTVRVVQYYKVSI